MPAYREIIGDAVVLSSGPFPSPPPRYSPPPPPPSMGPPPPPPSMGPPPTAPSLSPSYRPTTVTAPPPPSGPVAPASAPYYGTRPIVLDLTSNPPGAGGWNKATSGDGNLDAALAGGTCYVYYSRVLWDDKKSAPDALCKAATAGPGRVTGVGTYGADFVVGFDNDGVTPMAIAFFGNRVMPFSKDPLKSLLHGLTQTLVAAAAATGVDSSSLEGHDFDEWIFRGNKVQLAASALSAIQASGKLGRSLSDDSAAFLGNQGSTVQFAKSAAAIAHDLQDYLAIPGLSAGAGGTGSGGTTAAKTNWPAGSIAVWDDQLSVYHGFVPAGTALSGGGFGDATTPPAAYANYAYAQDIAVPKGGALPANVVEVPADVPWYKNWKVWLAIGGGALALGGAAYAIHRSRAGRHVGLLRGSADDHWERVWMSRLTGRSDAELRYSIERAEAALPNARNEDRRVSHRAAIRVARGLLARNPRYAAFPVY